MLDIEMEQIAGSGVLVANYGHGGLQVADAIQAQTAENAADGGAAQARGLSDVQAGEALAAKLFDALNQSIRRAAWGPQRTRRTVGQTRGPLLAIPGRPLA